ncbi:MAG: OmpH family outer membrane protein [Saprospiraceae bacterium]|nr:OmpH family outer membrane protein [Saprospiraceae bacterium]
MKKIFCISAICLILFAFESKAQQAIGYINSVSLLNELAEVKAADSELDALQKQLQKQGQAMVEAYQAKYKEVSTKEQSGEMSPKQIEEEGAKLKAEEKKITDFEQEMNSKVQAKREALYKPILDKINGAIEAVAKEKALKYVFDSSTGIVLYADDSADITALVKAKLNM